MSANKQQHDLAVHWADRCAVIFGKESITPDERIEIETLCALGIELIKLSSAYRLRKAGRLVEIRYLNRSDKNAL